MVKNIKRLVLLALLAGLFYGLNYAYRAFPIISGYGAKNLCSCVFVSGRTVEDVQNNELKVNPLLSLGTFDINLADSSATGSVFGLVEKKAIFRQGLGCTLINELSEEEVRNQSYKLVSISEPVDSLFWPYGSQRKDTTFSNVNYDKLNQAVANAFEESDPEVKVNTRGIVVVYKGHIIAEQYAENFDVNTPQMGWSMTKSVTATLIGMLIKDGQLSLTQPAPVDGWSDDRSAITIDQLLRMSSGLAWEEVYDGPSTAVSMLYQKADMGGYAAAQKLAQSPDEVFNYSSGTSNILAKIVRQKVGEANYYNYIRERLFEPLGMTTAVIEPDASGTFVGSSYMYASPRDWAKFGLLYLNEGLWNGEQLLPTDWTTYVSTPTQTSKTNEYGAHFWLNASSADAQHNVHYPDAPKDLFSANGFEGQKVFIIPSEDMVIVRLGQTKKRGSFDFNKLVKEVVAAVN